MGWSASGVGREDNHTKSVSACVLRGQSVGSPRDEARVGRTARDPDDIITRLRPLSRRPGAASVKKCLSQRRGMERAPRWLRRQPRQVRQRARTPYGVGRFSTARSARGPHGTEFRRCCHEASKPQPPTWRGVCEEEPQPTAWGGAPLALAANTTTPSPLAHECSVGSRPVLHGAMRAWAARHGSRTLWPRCFEAAAADLARSLRR